MRKYWTLIFLYAILNNRKTILCNVDNRSEDTSFQVVKGLNARSPRFRNSTATELSSKGGFTMIRTLKKNMASVLAVTILFCSMGVAVNAAPNNFSETAKQDYYEKYTEIVADVASKTERDISLLPMDEFTEEDWLPPEEFRSLITALANWVKDCNELDSSSKASATKSSKITIDGRDYSLSITGDFNTAFRSYTERYHFSGLNSFTSSMQGGTWEQTGYEYLRIDAGRTYAAYISGEYTVAGAVFENVLAYVEFYCGANGDVR